MITIKDIIALCRLGYVKNIVFISGDAANLSVTVDENSIPWFKQDQPIVRCNIFELSQEEIDRIDEENDYYSKPVWDDFREKTRQEYENEKKSAQ